MKWQYRQRCLPVEGILDEVTDGGEPAAAFVDFFAFDSGHGLVTFLGRRQLVGVGEIFGIFHVVRIVLVVAITVAVQ